MILSRPYLVLFILALLVRLLAAWPQQQPNYMDAAYSYVNALNLVAGRGFVEDFVWNYLGQPGLPPQPSHLYWMPLTSILAGLGMVIGGTSYRAAQIPFILLSALLAPLTYWITYALSGQRWLSWLAGLLAIFSGFYFPYWTAIDNFTPFAVAGSLTLLAAWQGVERSKNAQRGREAGSGEKAKNQPNLQPLLWFFIAGVFSALAHLARADGPLLLIAIVLVYVSGVGDQVSSVKQHASHIPERSLPVGHPTSHTTSHVSRLTLHVSRFILPLSLGYLLVMAPWFIRNWQVMGTPLPTAGSQTIWLTNYDEFFSYHHELSAQTFFAQGLGPVLQGRWWVFTTNLQTVLAVWGMVFLAPLALLGAWSSRHHLLIQLAGLYSLLLFVVMTLIFAFPGARGGLFHSGAALLPFVYAAAMVGLDRAVDWVAARRRRWNAPFAKRFFGLGLIIIAIVLSGFIYYGRVLKNNAWNSADALYPAIAAWVAQENPSATVMIGNPPAYRYHGGGLSVVVPNENIETTLQAARHYQVDYLILDHNRPEPLAEVYSQTLKHPALSLVQTFTDDADNPIYIFRISPP
jgi:hypothetical protein